MISAARVLGLAVTGAALLGVDAMAAPASAQPVCKGERVTARSEGRIRGEGFATNEAKQNWEKAAQERFGKSYGKWANAKDAKIDCEPVKSKRLGLPASLCTATGHPCAVGANTASVVEREDDRNRSRRDRIAERDADRLDAGDGRLRRNWRLAYLRRAYNAEMRFQDHLARRRRLAEERAYRRETAYWRNLHRRWEYWD